MHPEFPPIQKACAGMGYGECTAFSSSGGASCSSSGRDDLDGGAAEGASRRYVQGGRCEPPRLGMEDSTSRAQRGQHACYATENTDGEQFEHGSCSGHHAQSRWGSGDARLKCREHFVDIIADVSPGQRPQETYNQRSLFGMGGMNPIARCTKNHAEAGVFNVGDGRCLNEGCSNHPGFAGKSCLQEDYSKRTRFDLEGRIPGMRVRRSGPNGSAGFIEGGLGYAGVGSAGTRVHSYLGENSLDDVNMADGRCLHEGCSFGAANSKFRICCKEFARSHTAVGAGVVGDGFCPHEGCQLGLTECKFRVCCRQIARCYMASFGDAGDGHECCGDPAEDATVSALDGRYAGASCDRHPGWGIATATAAASTSALRRCDGTDSAQFVVAKVEDDRPASGAPGHCHDDRDRVMSTEWGRDTRRLLPGLPRVGAEASAGDDEDGEMERPFWIKMETDISM